MTFDEVLPALKQGKKIRRLIWVKIEGYTHAHLFIDKNGSFTFEFEPNVKIENYKLETQQILADDWEIGGYKYPSKEHLRDSIIKSIIE